MQVGSPLHMRHNGQDHHAACRVAWSAHHPRHDRLAPIKYIGYIASPPSPPAVAQLRVAPAAASEPASMRASICRRVQGHAGAHSACTPCCAALHASSTALFGGMAAHALRVQGIAQGRGQSWPHACVAVAVVQHGAHDGRRGTHVHPRQQAAANVSLGPPAQQRRCGRLLLHHSEAQRGGAWRRRRRRRVSEPLPLARARGPACTTPPTARHDLCGGLLNGSAAHAPGSSSGKRLGHWRTLALRPGPHVRCKGQADLSEPLGRGWAAACVSGRLPMRRHACCLMPQHVATPPAACTGADRPLAVVCQQAVTCW